MKGNRNFGQVPIVTPPIHQIKIRANPATGAVQVEIDPPNTHPLSNISLLSNVIAAECVKAAQLDRLLIKPNASQDKNSHNNNGRESGSPGPSDPEPAS